MSQDRCPSCGRPIPGTRSPEPAQPSHEERGRDYIKSLPPDLYRLKSNRDTIVKYSDGFTNVVWCSDMLSGYDARWMVHHPRNKQNLIPLSASEREEVIQNLKRFLCIKEQA